MFTNRYIFTYATIMIIIVAAVLATASNVLKPFQVKNQELEKIKNILSVADVLESGKNYTADELYDIFDQVIVDQQVVDFDGNQIEGEKAFDIDLAVEVKKEAKDKKYPVYIAESNGTKRYIVPIRGKGLWGPVWGLIAVAEDGNTVLGANFGHQGETPGLGAEIEKPKFGNQFMNKTLFDEDGTFTSIDVVKGGARPDDPHGVDAISGGTITSRGVAAMLYDNLKGYEKYFNNLKK